MTSKIKKAMVLAAGEGTRLRPVTLTTPKALVPVGGVPLILYTLGWLKHHGVSGVAINLCYLGDKVKDAVGDGSRWGMRVLYSPEETLLGTAGGVKRVEHFFDGAFVLVYGDILTDFDLSRMAVFHARKRAAATIALMEVEDTSQVGVVGLAKDGRITSFIEKPPKGTHTGNLANAAVYVLEKKVLDLIPGVGQCDFGHNVFPALLQAGLPIYGYPLARDEYIMDIGSLEKYAQADKDIREGRVKTFLTETPNAKKPNSK